MAEHKDVKALLVEYLKELHLPAMRAGYEEFARQAQQEGHIGHIVHERIGEHLGARAMFASHDKSENQVAHAGAVRHNQSAEHRSFHAAFGHGFQSPNHEE